MEENKDMNPAGEGSQDWTPPEGFEAEMFDEQHAPKFDVIKAKFDSSAAELAKEKTNVENMRKMVSAKGGLGKVEEYSSGFKPEGRISEILSDTESDQGKALAKMLTDFDAVAHKSGLSLTQANDIKGEMFKLLDNVNVISLDPESRKTALAAAQKEVLGDNASAAIKTNADFVRSWNVLSDKEKEMLTLAAEQGNPHIVSVIDKIRVMFGKGKSSDIPASANNDGLASDVALWDEYANPSTSPARKQEILTQRKAAGRPVKFAHM
jgi:hypothetical protein